jgi:hypothetical protein
VPIWPAIVFVLAFIALLRVLKLNYRSESFWMLMSAGVGLPDPMWEASEVLWICSSFPPAHDMHSIRKDTQSDSHVAFTGWPAGWTVPLPDSKIL